MGRGRMARQTKAASRHTRRDTLENQAHPKITRREEALKILADNYGPDLTESGAPRYNAEHWLWAFNMVTKGERKHNVAAANDAGIGQRGHPNRRQRDTGAPADTHRKSPEDPVRNAE